MDLLAAGCSLLLAVVGCASGKHDMSRGPFSASAPFSKTVAGSGDAVCWSVKRALLSQGYLLERSGEPGVLTGTRDYQPTDKLNVTVRLQTTCADNRNGTSIVFVTADRRFFHGADDQRSGWDWRKPEQQEQGSGRSAGQRGQATNGARLEMTPSTLANNAAENNKKVQTTQQRKSWYHGW